MTSSSTWQRAVETVMVLGKATLDFHTHRFDIIELGRFRERDIERLRKQAAQFTSGTELCSFASRT